MTALAIMRRADNKLTATFQLGRNTHVNEFWWVNAERVLISIAEKFGEMDQPRLTGELYAINADGSKGELLVGQRVVGAGLGTKIQPKKVERVAAFLVDDLPGDDKRVVISVMPFSGDPYTRAEEMDVYTGRRRLVARLSVAGVPSPEADAVLGFDSYADLSGHLDAILHGLIETDLSAPVAEGARVEIECMAVGGARG